MIDCWTGSIDAAFFMLLLPQTASHTVKLFVITLLRQILFSVGLMHWLQFQSQPAKAYMHSCCLDFKQDTKLRPCK